MKISGMKKITAVILALLLCLGAASSCEVKPNDDVSSTKESSSSANTETETETETENETDIETDTETDTETDIETDTEEYLRTDYVDADDPKSDLDEVDYSKLVFLSDIDYVFEGEGGKYPIGEDRADILNLLEAEISANEENVTSVNDLDDAVSLFNQLVEGSKSDKYTLLVTLYIDEQTDPWSFHYSPTFFTKVFYGSPSVLVYSRAQIEYFSSEINHFSPETIMKALLNYTKYSCISKIVICAPGEADLT